MKSLVLKQTTGFSLIELLVFIVVVGLFSATTIRLLDMVSHDHNDPMIQASMVKKAQALIQKINFKSYNDIKLSNNQKITDAYGVNFLVNIFHAGRQFQLPDDQVKYISVTVSYKQNESFVLSTYRFDY